MILHKVKLSFVVHCILNEADTVMIQHNFNSLFFAGGKGHINIYICQPSVVGVILFHFLPPFIVNSQKVNPYFGNIKEASPSESDNSIL